MAGALCGILAMLSSALLFHLNDTLSVSTVALSASLGLTASALTQLICTHTLFSKPNRKGTLTKIIIWMAGVSLSAFVMLNIQDFLKKNWQKDTSFQNLVIIAIVFLLGCMVYLVWIFLFRKLIFSKTSSGKEDTF
jgi:hypothetical protein